MSDCIYPVPIYWSESCLLARLLALLDSLQVPFKTKTLFTSRSCYHDDKICSRSRELRSSSN